MTIGHRELDEAEQPPDDRLKPGNLDGKPYENFVRYFQRCANGLAMRFGGKVYLVGGAVTEPKPRDYDVRVVVSQLDFLRLFGFPAKEYRIENQWGEAEWNRAAENLKQSREAFIYCHALDCRNVDVQIQTVAEANGHLDKPRVRIDAANAKHLSGGYKLFRLHMDGELERRKQIDEKAAAVAAKSDAPASPGV